MTEAVGQTSGIMRQEVSGRKTETEHELIPPKIYEVRDLSLSPHQLSTAEAQHPCQNSEPEQPPKPPEAPSAPPALNSADHLILKFTL